MQRFSLACSLLLAAFAVSAETFPPLQSIPKNIEELWAGYDPDQEDLETKVIREGILMQLLIMEVREVELVPEGMAWVIVRFKTAIPLNRIAIRPVG